MDAIVIVSTALIAVATIVIACYARQTKISQYNFQIQLSDLYKGIIISTLQSSNTDSEAITRFIAEFKEYYDGETKIF